MNTVNVLYKTDLTLKNLSRLPGNQSITTFPEEE